MTSQIIFAAALLLTFGVFGYTTWRYVKLFQLTKPAFPVKDIGKRISLTLKVALGSIKNVQKALYRNHACPGFLGISGDFDR
jgi:hypothetical protein